ncbi:MAG: four helix bundle protein [Saprospiraceae bacterium]
MDKYKLQDRFKCFAIGIIELIRNLPNHKEYWKISDQIIRSGTSSTANYRAACRAKSDADFINKLKIVEEELDETMFWLEIIQSIKRFYYKFT